jgi:hypothetical protein
MLRVNWKFLSVVVINTLAHINLKTSLDKTDLS